MQLEDWVEVIKSVLAPAAFKEVGVAALRALYQRPVFLTDGTGDGGVDAWIDLSSGPSGRVPVQFHAGRSIDWDRKLAEDLEKPQIKNKGFTQLFFVCAQTPTSDKVQRRVAEFLRSHGITVTVLDARVIASQMHDPMVLEALRKVAPLPSPERVVGPWSAASGARLAFIFFHEASGDFRAEVARSVLAACLVRATAPIPTEELLDQGLALVGGGIQIRRTFRRQLEAMLAEGKATRESDGVQATTDFVLFTEGLLSVQTRAAAALREDCVRALEAKVYSDQLRQEAVDSVFDDLGLLLRQSLVEKLPGGQRDGLAVRLNAVERRLYDTLKPGGGTAQTALKALVNVASESVYGRALASAELFIQLTGRDVTEVARALTGRDRVEVLLDTSVAMPTLCALLDRVATGWITSEIVLDMHGLLRARGIKMVVPHLYVEEMAAHMVNAAQRYQGLIGEDPDLARSENFFVAHYHAVSASLGEPATAAGFNEFLSDLGLPEASWSGDFLKVRQQVERRLKEHLEHYDIAVNRVPYVEALSLVGEPVRPETVLRHDRCVVRWMDERAQESADGLVLCSQDRWLLHAVAGCEWLAVDPAALVDLVQLVRPEGTVGPLASLRELASRFGETVHLRAAAVWDVLAELEGPHCDCLKDLDRFRMVENSIGAATRLCSRARLRPF